MKLEDMTEDELYDEKRRCYQLLKNEHDPSKREEINKKIAYIELLLSEF